MMMKDFDAEFKKMDKEFKRDARRQTIIILVIFIGSLFAMGLIVSKVETVVRKQGLKSILSDVWNGEKK